jgi:hypothetical protein
VSKYNKLIAAVLAALTVALPAFAAAQSEGVSLGEWLTIAGLFLAPITVALSPANVLPTEELAKQVRKNPELELKRDARPTGLSEY